MNVIKLFISLKPSKMSLKNQVDGASSDSFCFTFLPLLVFFSFSFIWNVTKTDNNLGIFWIFQQLCDRSRPSSCICFLSFQ